jgi:thiol-disulfide isomerase/thioredoxin
LLPLVGKARRSLWFALAGVAVSFAAAATAGAGSGAKPDAKDAKKDEHHAAVEPDPPVLHLADEAPIFNAVLHNPKEAGVEHLDLSSMVGADAEEPGVKVVLISFFATWCGPCKKELPFLVQLSHTYKEKGLRVISIAIDKDEARWPEIAELVAKNKVDYPVVKDRYNLIARRFLGEKTALPSVFLIGRDGLVKLVKQGYPNDAAEFLKAEVERALALDPAN